MGKNRLYYIDVIKVLGIYLVILGHLPLTNIIFTKFIFSFHMPLFFFLQWIFVQEEQQYLFRYKKEYSQIITRNDTVFHIGSLVWNFSRCFCL